MEVISFIRAVARHWATLMTGGFVMAVLGAAERYLGGNVPASVFWTIALLFLFAAFYLAWRDKDRALRATRVDINTLRGELDEERRLGRPDLVGIHGAKMVGDTDGYTVVHMQASIRNLGAPSIAEAYGLVIRVGTETFIGRHEVIGKGTKLYLGGNALKVELEATDALYEKTRLPIPTGGQESGWLRFSIPELPASRKDVLFTVGAIWVLTFRDVTQLELQAVEAITPTGLSTPIGYRPGAGGTIHS